ncbi:cupin domain-containing protein [Rhodanobacter aciditrophus]|uniref:cupin domain-containing protein n=1 Tax=Rhodanobacter aciditrophus TaxID=1623218 RepID=UPI003CE9A7A9
MSGAAVPRRAGAVPCLAAFLAAAAAMLPGRGLAATEQALLSAPLSSSLRGGRLEAIRVTYAPGQSTPPHAHGRDVYAYVLSGRIRGRLAGGSLRVYGPGEGWFEPAGVRHVICGNASASEPASMLVIFILAPGPHPGTSDPAANQLSVPARTQSR